MNGSPITIAVDCDWGRKRRYEREAELTHHDCFCNGCGMAWLGSSETFLIGTRMRHKAKQGGVSRWRAGSLTVNLRGASPL
jgi:hypothetical protein